MEITRKRTDFSEISTEILGRGNYLRFRATGGSMHPFIKSGEIIKVSPINNSTIRIGTIIFYRTSWGNMVAHRVIKKHRKNNKRILVTKGDNSFYFDPPVQEDNIFGEVTAIENPSVTINLDCKLWSIANYLIARYSVLSLLIYRGIYFLKRVLIGNRKNPLSCFGSKVLSMSLSLFLMLLINFLCFMQKLKSKLKL